MLKNFFKTAARNLFKNKGYSAITIIGLAIGMASTLMILMFIQNELSYDKYHRDADRIHRMYMFFRFGGREANIAVVAPHAAEVMVRDFPEVINAVRFRDRGSYIIQYKDKGFREQRIIFADNSFFEVFSISLLKGDPHTALTSPQTLVMSRLTAEKYFGEEDPVGKTVRLDNRTDYQVTGVFEEIPPNSHFHFDVLLSMPSLDESKDTSWLSQNFQTYLLLREDADPAVLEKKLPGVIMKYMAPQIERILGQSFEKASASDIRIELYIQPMLDIHLHSDLEGELEPNSDSKYITIFFAIALFILIIASINFVNLTTARASGRAKEVGIRKVMGSFRRDLIRRFLAESMTLSLISILLAGIIVRLCLHPFNRLSGKALMISDLFTFPMIAFILGITLFVGIIAGSYPAFVIAAFRPADTLRGRLKAGVGSGPLRSALVVFQFAASVILIIGTIVVTNQLHFIQNKKLGYDKEQVLILDNAYLLQDQTETFKEEMKKFPHISDATVSGFLPVPSNRSSTTVFPEGNFNHPGTTSIQVWRVDYDYIPTMGMNIVSGRNFSREYSTDTEAALLNQSAVKQYGFDDPLGKWLTRFTSNEGEMETRTIIGVVEDFHFESLRDSIQPLMMYMARNTGHISFRFDSDDVKAVIRDLQATWKKFLPNQPFEFFFLDDRFFSLYSAEKRVGQIFGVFASLAIFIGCLGLFGLASFIAEKRTKEIGIRKVLGASVPNVVRILLKEFVLLVMIANIVAWPAAFLIMRGWLQDFAYRSSLGLWIFAAAGLLSLSIAMITVSFKAVRTALADPVKSLRYE